MTDLLDPDLRARLAGAGALHPFVRHQVDPALVDRVWTAGDALVVAGGRPRMDAVADGPVLTCLGPSEDLAPLLAQLAGEGVHPSRVTVDAAAAPGLPPTWTYDRSWRWDWMMTTTTPAESGAPAVPVDDHRAAAVLEVAYPTAHGQPGSAGIEGWLGLAAADQPGAPGEAAVAGLVAVGAVMRMSDGTGHLRSVTVLPALRGRGLARILSAALTHRALAGPCGVATLGVYSDNAPAIAVYHRLGYTRRHLFVSGLVLPR